MDGLVNWYWRRLVVLGYVVLPGLVLAGHPSTLNWSILTSLSVYNYSTLLGGPLGEEPGWRGCALPRLEVRFGPVRAGLLLGLLWAGWHLPLFLVEGWGSPPLWSYALIVMGLSIIMTYGANMGRFSIITAVAMHAAFNTATRFLNGLFSGTAPRANLPFAIVFPMCGICVAIALIVITLGRLAYHEERHLQ